MKKQWKETPFEIQICKEADTGQPRAYVTDSQDNPNNQIYPTASVGGYASGAALPYPGTAPQNSGYSISATSQSNHHYVASNSGCGSNVPLFSPNSRAISNSDLTSIPSPGYFVPVQSRGIHISKLDHRISEADIRNLVVGKLRIGRDEILQVLLKKGYALVTFETNEMAQRATRALDGMSYRNHSLTVKMDKDRQTIYPSQPLTVSYSVAYQAEGHHWQTPIEAVGRSTMPNPSAYCVSVTTMRIPYPQSGQSAPTYSVAYDPQEENGSDMYTEESPRRLSGPDITKPVVVNGSKDRHKGQSST